MATPGQHTLFPLTLLNGCMWNFGEIRRILSNMQNKQTPAMSAAEKQFKRRETLKADAPKAVAEYYAANQAVLDRTKKLRAERLARETEAQQQHNVIRLRSKK